MNRDPHRPPQNQATRLLRTEDGSTFRCLLVDEYWTHVGWFESEIPDCTVGQEVTVDNGRRFVIVVVVPNPNPDAEYTATWNVEPA